MSIFDRAFDVLAKTRDRGDLIDHEPYPLPGDMPWEVPAQWRVSDFVWKQLLAEAKRATTSGSTGASLLGFPVVVDPDAEFDLMVLERRPLTRTLTDTDEVDRRG